MRACRRAYRRACRRAYGQMPASLHAQMRPPGDHLPSITTTSSLREVAKYNQPPTRAAQTHRKFTEQYGRLRSMKTSTLLN